MAFSKEYAAAYDFLYQDKDYEQECDYIEALLQRYRCRPRTILDLGCGTGSHAIVLARRGYRVTGIDRSAAMLEIAARKAGEAGLAIEFRTGEIAEAPGGGRHDAVISLFSVMGLQTTNAALEAACKAARRALAPGGVFLFDCWNGYAVMDARPVPRTKEVVADEGTITRSSSAELDIMNQVVRVAMVVRRVRGADVTEAVERQSVRFFYPQELRYFLTVAGFQAIDIHPFLSPDAALTENDWTMMVAAR